MPSNTLSATEHAVYLKAVTFPIATAIDIHLTGNYILRRPQVTGAGHEDDDVLA